MDASVSEDGVGAGHVDRGGIVGADGHRRSTARVGNSGRTGQCGNVVETYHLAQLNSGSVERVSESVRCCDVASIAADEVLWRVGLAAIVVGEGGLVSTVVCLAQEVP